MVRSGLRMVRSSPRVVRLGPRVVRSDPGMVRFCCCAFMLFWGGGFTHLFLYFKISHNLCTFPLCVGEGEGSVMPFLQPWSGVGP